MFCLWLPEVAVYAADPMAPETHWFHQGILGVPSCRAGVWCSCCPSMSVVGCKGYWLGVPVPHPPNAFWNSTSFPRKFRQIDQCSSTSSTLSCVDFNSQNSLDSWNPGSWSQHSLKLMRLRNTAIDCEISKYLSCFWGSFVFWISCIQMASDGFLRCLSRCNGCGMALPVECS